MLYTLQQARDLVKPFVNAGSCTTATIDARINEALERLCDGEDWEKMRRLVRFQVYENKMGLPYNIEKLMWATTDGTPAKIFGRAYQFLSSGPGDLDYYEHQGGFLDLADLGDWPTMYDHAGQLVALSAEPASLSVRGFDSDNYERRITVDTQTPPVGVDFGFRGTWDETWGLALSTETLARVSDIHKAQGTAYVRLYSVADGAYQFLGEIHPLQTRPQFRRYRLNKAPTTETTDVLALVKLRFVPLVEATDLIPIDSLQALKLMVIAIREENGNNMQNALNYEANAKRVLTARDQSATLSTGTPVILDNCHRTSLGRALNHRSAGFNI